MYNKNVVKIEFQRSKKIIVGKLGIFSFFLILKYYEQTNLFFILFILKILEGDHNLKGVMTQSETILCFFLNSLY